MFIRPLTRDEFGHRLAEVVSPSQPIGSIEFLRGRDKELDQIEKALYAPGRHVFIYGDRGVGKSSLAATAANLYQSADAGHLDVSCAPDATLCSLVASITRQAIERSRVTSTKNTGSWGAEARWFKVGGSSEISEVDLSTSIKTVGDAVEVLREVAVLHSERPIVVVDEFDRILASEERARFADLLKQLGDKKVPIKFIFTGVGKTLDELLGAHASASRQLHTVELPRLSWDARWDIAINAARTFDAQITRDIYVRIAAMSDGFPYYVHLLTEQILWQAYEDSGVVQELNWDHFFSGLNAAIQGINAELRRPYEQAIHSRSDDFEEVLWATADGEDLHRFQQDMYQSYLTVMSQRQGRIALPQERFADRVRTLRKPTHGEILQSDPNRPGLYSYREKMLRGFVRMQAEAHGVDLRGEEGAQKQRSTVRPPASVRRGYHGPSIPHGVKISKPIR